MIDIEKLTEDDKGREVVYERHGEEKEFGYINSWNKRFIFVRYGKNQQSKATEPEDLRFAMEVYKK